MDKITAAASVRSNHNEDYHSSGQNCLAAVNNRDTALAPGNTSVPVLSMTISEFSQNDADDDYIDDDDDLDYESQDITLEEEPRLAH